MKIDKYLSSLEYPGRVLIGGNSKDGKPVALYLITGRSQSSKERVIVKEEDKVSVKSLTGDENVLLVYNLSVKTGQGLLFANGRHLEEIKKNLDEGESLLNALTDIFPEEDEYKTPRIALLLKDDGKYELSRVSERDGKEIREVWKYQITPGFGHALSTYSGSLDSPEASKNDPVVVDLESSLSAFTDLVWSSLNPDNKVSLYAFYDDAERIINERTE